MLNRELFFSQCKLLGAIPMVLSQAQVDSINAILDQWEKQGIENKNFLAYIFATTKHETGNTFLPIEEKGSNDYLSKYWNNTKLRGWLGNIGLDDSWRFKGRGFCMITGRGLYKKIGKILGMDLEKSPELAKDYRVAAEIIIRGMLAGWFTGKKLGDYVSSSLVFDSINARRVINSLDKAELISGYYRTFLKCF